MWVHTYYGSLPEFNPCCCASYPIGCTLERYGALEREYEDVRGDPRMDKGIGWQRERDGGSRLWFRGRCTSEYGVLCACGECMVFSE